MHALERARKANGQRNLKYHGKWPFRRVLGAHFLLHNVIGDPRNAEHAATQSNRKCNTTGGKLRRYARSALGRNVTSQPRNAWPGCCADDQGAKAEASVCFPTAHELIAALCVVHVTFSVSLDPFLKYCALSVTFVTLPYRSWSLCGKGVQS
jgi:hypothetical protein